MWNRDAHADTLAQKEEEEEELESRWKGNVLKQLASHGCEVLHYTGCFLDS